MNSLNYSRARPARSSSHASSAGVTAMDVTLICCLLLGMGGTSAKAGEERGADHSAYEDFDTAGSVQMRGRLSVVSIDPAPGSRSAPSHACELIVGGGEIWRLSLTEHLKEAARRILALDGADVLVRGMTLPGSRRLLQVEQLHPMAGAGGDGGRVPSFYGPQPYVWILLRFAGNPSTPQPSSWFETQALGPAPSMDHYWREVSFNNINMQGSEVAGWLDLPHGHDYYVYEFDPNSPGVEVDRDRLFADAFAVADPHVDFRLFSGINFCFNDTLDCCSQAWREEFTLDGETRNWGWTLLANWGWGNHNKIAHEMGHSFWLPHSTGPGAEIGDSWWDIMSHDCGMCQIIDPVYGYIGLNTIAYHKAEKGWIHPDHQFTLPTSPSVSSVWLNDLAVVPPPGRMLMARSRYDVFTYYTLERRRWTGYDAGLPDETVIIHEIDTRRLEPAWVVDADGNGNCNDEGGRWDQGETFWDENHEFVATVEEVDDSGSMVTLSNAGRHDVYVDRYASGYENGSATYPWNSIDEGYGSVYPEGDVHIVPANYPGAMTFRKAATLRRFGSSGIVTLGN